ncbi:DMT family transporter [Comamonas flocculans]|uniref:DMT family transporter n=1 Tax=Comamonas flocculans TaxID=2597701 RepID=A0A5B8RQA4_9BURK|nr:DMT family transporter [Comamonas flocculans]QEA11841.1 DMT family transporter [Comamonas flocculans]
MSPLSRPAAFACLALSMSLVGTYVALSKPLALVFPVMLLAWLRFGLGALAMLGWLRKPMDEPALSPHARGLLFLNALLGNFLFTVLMIYGVSLTSASTAGVIMASIPAWVALLSRFFLGERIAARTGLAIALAVAGIALFALGKPAAPMPAELASTPSTGTRWLGGVLLLAASCCEAAYSVIGKRLTASLGPRRICALMNLWGFVLATPAGLWLAWQFDFSAVSWPHWLLLLFYALAACVWSVWLWMTGLSTVPASQAGIFTTFLPLSAALVGVLALGESMGALQWLAFALAMASVVLATARRPRFRRASPAR